VLAPPESIEPSSIDAIRSDGPPRGAEQTTAGGTTMIEELVAISEHNLIRKNVRWAVREGILSSATGLRTALDLFT